MLALTVKTDDVTRGRKDVDPHGRLRANGLKFKITFKSQNGKSNLV